MYKLLLCWRYLLTRYLALVCIVSVMLGVATLIVVNSVMSGFSAKLRDRLHGLLSDVVIETNSFYGFPEAQEHFWNNRQPEFHIQPAADPGAQPAPDDPEWAHEPKVPQGAIVGHAIAHFRLKEKGPDGKPVEITPLECGDDLILTTVSGQS